MAHAVSVAEPRPPRVRSIPRVGIEMTELGLGGGSLGGLYEPVSEDVACATVQAAMENGIRYFDTAPMYGHGLGEERLGAALRPYDRDSFVLGTKVGFVIEPSVADGEDFETKYCDPFALDGHHDFSYDACMKCFEESLVRLGADRIDIAYIHDPDEAEVLLPPEKRTGIVHFHEVLGGAYKALEKLRDEGAVRAIGIGMFGAASLAEFAQAVDFDVFLLAGGYTLLEHDSVESLLPVLEARRVSLVSGAVFKSGILATGTSVANPYYNYRPADVEMVARVQRIEEQCAEFGVSLGAAALQFPLGNHVVVSVIPGAKSTQEVEQNLRYVSENIPAEFWEALKERGLIHPLAPVGEHDRAEGSPATVGQPMNPVGGEP